VGWHEHGERGSLHDHRTGHKDHEPWSAEDRYGVETIRAVYSFRDAGFFPVWDGCESAYVINWTVKSSQSVKVNNLPYIANN
jgi:hypothetical protein